MFKKLFLSLNLLYLYIVCFSANVYAQGSGQSSCNDIKTCVGIVNGYINKIIPILIGFAVVVFLWGILKYFLAGGDEKQLSESRQYIVYGIIGLVVIVSAWGLVAFVVNSFFSGEYVIPQFKAS